MTTMSNQDWNDARDAARFLRNTCEQYHQDKIANTTGFWVRKADGTVCLTEWTKS